MVGTGVLNATVNGIITGSVIALGAVSLSILYSIAEVPNFAHGAMITIGAYLVFVINKPSVFLLVSDVPGFAFWLGIVFALLGGGALGAVIELAMFRHFRRKGGDLITKLIATMGLALVLRNVVVLFAGGESQSYETPLIISNFYDFYLATDGVGLRILQRSGGEVVRLAQWGYSWGLMAGIITVGAIAAVATHRLYVRREIDARFITGKAVAITTFGAVVLLGLALGRGAFVGGATLYATRVIASLKHGLIIATSIAAMAFLSAFLTFTKTGKAMRASADNLGLAEVSGINTDRVQLVVWILAGVLTALAGGLFGWFANIHPELGFSLLLPIFAAVILGGISSPTGAVIGSYVIGLTMSLGVYFAPFDASPYRTAFAFVVLLVLLLVKPEGLREGY
ncbi:MAG: branched-chain amino acid ABC transporter permease [Halorhabdus sp.]